MADGIDPRVHAMPGATPEPFVNRPTTHAKAKELLPPHDAALSGSKPPSQTIDITRDAFAPYGVVNASLVRHALMIKGRSAHVAR
jgi:hypothetical protein